MSACQVTSLHEKEHIQLPNGLCQSFSHFFMGPMTDTYLCLHKSFDLALYSRFRKIFRAGGVINVVTMAIMTTAENI